MLLIRPAVRTDVHLLKTLIHEMGDTALAGVDHRGDSCARWIWATEEFRVLIADWDSEPAGYAFFFNCYSTFRGRGLFLRISLCAHNFGERRLATLCFRMSSRRSARGVFWDHAECAGVESTRD